MKKTKITTKHTLHLLLVLLLMMSSVFCFHRVVNADEDNTNLNRFTSKVLINNSVPANPMKDIIPEKEYSLSISFAETENLQFNNVSMNYTMPAGFHANKETEKIEVKVTVGNNTYTIEENEFTVDESGNVSFRWNTSDSDFSQLANCANAQITLDFKGIFDDNASELDFGNGHVVNVEMKTGGPTVKKTAQYDAQSNKINYTIDISSVGTSKNVTITDILSGTALSYDENSFQIKDPDSWQFKSFSPELSSDNHSFGYTLTEIPDGKTYQIQYSADVDLSKITGKGSAEQTANQIKVVNDKNQSAEDSIELKDKIIYQSLNKSVSDGTIIDGYKTTLWTITYNSEAHVSMANCTLKDTLNANDTNTSYSGQGITIRKYKKDGTFVSNDLVLWSQLNVNSDSKEFEYTIPESDIEAYKYEMSYTTTTDVSSMIQNSTISNKVEDVNNQLSSGDIQASVGPETSELLGVKKIVTSVNEQEITWKIQLHVPQVGLSNAYVEDLYPCSSSWYDGANHTCYDSLKDNSIQISGLLDGESYQIDVSDDHKLVIRFYQDDAQTQTGLKSSQQARDIDITLTTNVNQDWLDDAQIGKQSKEHTNNVQFFGNGQSVQASASALPTRLTIEKRAANNGNISFYKENLPVYKFEIVLTGITGAFELQDTFDTRYLQLFDNDSWESSYLFYGDNQWSQSQRCGKVTMISNENGLQIGCPDNILLKDSNDSYYPYYKIVYYLIVKDENALKQLKKKAAENGGMKSLDNIVSYGNETSSASINYKYEGLIKELVNENDINGNNTLAQYKITINPEATTMNNGQRFNVIDEFTNLRIDYTSISVKDNKGNDLVANNDVTYNFKGNTGTFTVPDQKTIIIQYNAYVIGTGYINFVNKVSYSGYEAEKSCSKNISSQGGGSASLLSITILKCEEGMTSHRLAGAQFELYKAETNERLGNSVYTTDANGTVTIQPGMETDNFTLFAGQKYYLKEIKAPEGYQLSTVKYYFTIDSNNQVDYDNYVFADNDIIKISNKLETVPDTPKNAKMTIKANKVLSGGELHVFDYLFNLKNSFDENQVFSIGNDSQGNILFDSLEFNEAKDYVFILSEEKPNTVDNQIIYDETRYQINVKVENDIQDNNLKITKVIVKNLSNNNIIFKSSDNIQSGDFQLDLTSNNGTFRNVKKANVTISKENNNHQKISGAKLRITGNNMQNQAINPIEFTSSEELAKYEFEPGTYTLTEVEAPQGYQVAANIQFTVKENGDVYIGNNKIENNTITMVDQLKKYKVGINKTDAQNSPLKGAKLRITGNNMQNQAINPIEFTSSEELAKYEFEPGTYTLTEVEAPQGYQVAANIQFAVKENGDVYIGNNKIENNTITMVDQLKKYKVSINKTDAQNSPLKGAKLRITGNNMQNQAINPIEFTSSEELAKYEFEPGTYTLTEVEAPQGYQVANSIEFKVKKDGQIIVNQQVIENSTITMVDEMTSIKVGKYDIENNVALPGCTLQILDAHKQVVKEVTTTSMTQEIEIKGLNVETQYYFKEAIAPQGYAVNHYLIPFVLQKDGSLKVGTINEDQVISEDEDYQQFFENGILKSKDNPTSIKISKVDITTHKELAGAKLQILDQEGNVVKEWISSTQPKDIIGLETGVTYTLKETVAPAGYALTSQTTITLKDDGTIDEAKTTTKISDEGILLVEDQLLQGIDVDDHLDDQLKEEKKEQNNQLETGDESHIEQWALLSALSFLSFICLYLFGILDKKIR